MATLTLRDVPDDLLESLKADAARNRRTVNQETIARLEQAKPTRRTAKEMMGIMRRAWQIAPDLWLDPEEIDRRINEGRG